LPPYTPAGTVTNGAITITGSANSQNAGALAGTQPTSVPQTAAVALGATQLPSTFTGTAAAGQINTPFSNMQPTRLCTIHLKL
jgi:hypothetical protein